MSKWPYSTATWQRLRAAKLSVQPLCEVCLLREVVEEARVVDHVTAINAGGEPFPPIDRLMSMCEPCHSWKTNHEDRPDRRKKIGSAIKGCAVDGGSLDPLDEWATPGAFASRPIDGQVPAGKSNRELVSCDSFATSEREVF